MQILLNTDNRITGTLDLTKRVESEVHRAVDRFGDWLTRVEVHLKDVNSNKGGVDDIECMMEARPRGHPPVAVSERGASTELALTSAADTLETALDRLFGKLEDR